jgi:type I restriction enzyme S subunit
MGDSRGNSGLSLARGLGTVESIQWPLVPSSELFELRYGKALVESNRSLGTVPVFGTNGRCGWHDTPLFSGPGVVLGRKGQGPLGVEWTDQDYWVIDTAYTLALLRSDVELRYAYYLIKFVGLNHLKDGTSNPTLSRDSFGAQLFPLPPVSKQRAIAHILGTLDDKIELNRRMNETLEAMARALFKSWFVDFDPVRAKAEGRQPSGMDAETAKLFPSEFEQSELGEIPKGWRVAPLGDVLELKRGYDLPASLRQAGNVPIVSSSGPSGLHAEAKVKPPGIVTGRYGTIGIVFYVREPFWPLNTTLYVRDLKGGDALYTFHLLRLLDFRKFSDKAAVPGVNRNDLHQEPVVAVPLAVQRRFAETVGPWLELADNHVRQCSRLSKIRDALLPRLLSGEVNLDRIAEISAWRPSFHLPQVSP